MLERKGQSIPYKPLGRQLKALRLKANETLAEASGAVEIDVRELASFELGQTRPSEEVLILLLSHFAVKDEEAAKLWNLAGYQIGRPDSSHMISDSLIEQSDSLAKQPQILFTDIVDVMVNNYGVVMNFMQNGGQGQKPTIVARVGMSREHAASVLQILQMTLSKTEKNSTSFSKTPETPQEET